MDGPRPRALDRFGNDDIPLRQLLFDLRGQAGSLLRSRDSDVMDTLLDRLASAGALAIQFGRDWWLERVLDTLVAIYDLGFDALLCQPVSVNEERVIGDRRNIDAQFRSAIGPCSVMPACIERAPGVRSSLHMEAWRSWGRGQKYLAGPGTCGLPARLVNRASYQYKQDYPEPDGHGRDAVREESSDVEFPQR